MSNSWDRNFLLNLDCPGDDWMRDFIHSELEGDDGVGICNVQGKTSYAILFALYAYGVRPPYTLEGWDATCFLFGARHPDYRNLWCRWAAQDAERVWLPFVEWISSLEENYCPPGEHADITASDNTLFVLTIQLKCILLCLDACDITIPEATMQRCWDIVTGGWGYTLHVEHPKLNEILSRLTQEKRHHG